MIGYQITRTQLDDLIRQEPKCKDWLQAAAERTEKFRALGYFDEPEGKSIWSKVKPIYMRQQGGSKCAYCERKLESIELGRGEQDVEHFRPKRRVRNWKLPKSLVEQDIIATNVPDDNCGYYLLAYHPFNYLAACQPCNSALKRDCFPIAGKYEFTRDDPAALLSEKPFLIYPFGDFDDDPEALIRFHGVSPQPAVANGHGRQRALVTIEFFKLDDEATRKNLFRERAAIIIALYPQLEKIALGPANGEKSKLQAVVNGFISAEAAHANCARSYVHLFANQRQEAKAIFELACNFIAKIS